LGATSFVGSRLIPLLKTCGWSVHAFSRRPQRHDGVANWHHLPDQPPVRISHWICAAPIHVLPEYFSFIEASGANRVVALSSTSRFTKIESSDRNERDAVQRLIAAEDEFQSLARRRGVAWVILRPTLIYGWGRDRNVTEIARFVRRFGFFPLWGEARGLRQPIHVDDVAQVCANALQDSAPAGSAYDISGAEVLSYRAMVARICAAMGQPARMLEIPLPVFRFAVTLLRILPRYRGWSGAMAQRMSQDMAFDHSKAAAELGFRPRPFQLSSADVGGQFEDQALS
jgi:nucleoside-diphosphate-sugar epimerase